MASIKVLLSLCVLALASQSVISLPVQKDTLPSSNEVYLPKRLACNPPTPMSKNAPNIMMIGDSISMGGSGYSYFVRDMLENASMGTLAGSVQHGGGFGGGGQMASSANGAQKVTDCIGNSTGTLPAKAWSVITYNAGLHDCDTRERVEPDAYAANLKAIFETLKPAAHAVVFVDTTPYQVNPDGSDPLPAGIHMECVLQYNVIAKKVAAEVGVITIDDLWGYVEQFCGQFPKATSGVDAGNYTRCAVQSTGLHFFTHAPMPSGQQYTGLSVADSIIRLIPDSQILNTTTTTATPEQESLFRTTPSSEESDKLEECGTAPAPLNTSLPNVLVIGDSISMSGSGYFPALKNIMENPTNEPGFVTGALASAQHNGGTGNEQAGPSTNGAACIKTWVGSGGWDVITFNFGIHDCCPGGDGRPSGQAVNKTEYIKNLKVIYDTAHASLAKNGKIFFVTTTPISDGPDGHLTCNLTGTQFNSCIDDYNSAALSLLSSQPDVEIIDLNKAVTQVCGQGFSTCNLQRYANVHFTDAGKQFCAVVVSKGLAPALAPKWEVLTNKTTVSRK